MSIPKFDSNVYSEELYPVSESEHDEVLAMIGAEAEGFAGYGDWSAELESENFVVVNGTLRHKPEPSSKKVGGFEV